MWRSFWKFPKIFPKFSLDHIAQDFFFCFWQNGDNSSQTFLKNKNHCYYYQVVVVTWEQDLGQPDRTVGGRTDGRTSTTKNSRSLPPHTQNATPFVHTICFAPSSHPAPPSLPRSRRLLLLLLAAHNRRRRRRRARKSLFFCLFTISSFFLNVSL
jgi:hypothetical protein